MSKKSSSTWKTRSKVSTKHSSNSSRSSVAAVAHAEAEAAKVHLSFAEKEMKMKVEKAHLEASMDMLKQEKETAAAVAKADALEAAVDHNSERLSCRLFRDCTPMDSAQRTKDFVMQQAKTNSPSLSMPGIELFSDDQIGQVYEPQQRNTPVLLQEGNASSGFASAASYVHNNSNMNDFVRYLARRELVSTGLLKFNDQPESYRAWQCSFKNAIRNLDLTFSEEIDLLVKWLGKESAEHVNRIRMVNANNPERGLKMIWDRLQECYGSPEVIENSLFRRLESFPVLTNKDYGRLRELSDLLMELQSAKADGDLPGLAVLDTARGINPIVLKLPFGLQDRWLSVGSDYKLKHNVPFPPFDVFVNFVSQQARIRNDPSFSFTSWVNAPTKQTSWRQSKPKEISVHKTEVSPNVSCNKDKLFSNDCDKLCPIHKKTHPLRKCRVFQEKSLEERKAFLKENGICFRCCMSSLHIAKNCKAHVKCTDCGSERHDTVLHQEPTALVKDLSPHTDHGGEGNLGSSSGISSHCTQVCGGDLAGRSCSKICLAKVYPSGCPDKAVKLYAIIDDQSNRSMARSELFDMFGIQSPSSPYSLRTCAGIIETTGR